MSLANANPRSTPLDTPFTSAEKATINGLEADLAMQLAAKPKRLAHSLAVGREAERLARIYGVDPYRARVAGILHDWEKARPDDDLVPLAHDLGLAAFFDEDVSRIAPLLHGPVAAKTLLERYPWLGPEVSQAIARHTLGAADMSLLDMVLFVADGIEPGRGSVAALDAQRAMVGKASLFELWWQAFCDGIVYVIHTRRHLYSKTITIYNDVVQQLAAERVYG